MLNHALATESAAILALYRAVLGRPGCTWDEDYPGADTIADDLAAHSLYCLRDDGGHILGAVSRETVNELDDLPCWTLPMAHPCEIARVVIRPDAQGRGLACVMLRALFEHLRTAGYDGVRLLVSPGNPAACATYVRLGFNLCGQCERYGRSWLTGELSLR